MRVWNLGNTTVRNPRRLKDGLSILAELFEGQPWSEEGQVLFYDALVQRGVIEPKEGTGPSAKSRGIGGRKWAAAPNQLGLAAAWSSSRKGPVLMTPAGKELLAAADEREEQEVYLRQLLKYRLPSPLEKGGKYKGFDIMPFRFMLKVLYDLERAGLKGATKEEIALYVITSVRNDQAAEAVSRITNYRSLRDREKGLARKRSFFDKMRRDRVLDLYSEEFQSERMALTDVIAESNDLSSLTFRESLKKAAGGGKGSNTARVRHFVDQASRALISGSSSEDVIVEYELMRARVRGQTLMDYADSAVRYCRLTGLFTISGDKLVLSDERRTTIDHLVAEGFVTVPDESYLEYFRSSSLPQLPSDRDDFVQSHIRELEKKHLSLVQAGVPDALQLPVRPARPTPLELKRYARALESNVYHMREEAFSRAQSSAGALCDISDYFAGIASRELFGGTAYLPAFLEWAVWRVFLAIDQLAVPASATRGFELDDDLQPIHHARSGAADMVFRYEDFILICEVTLKTGVSQWSAEGESVPRHVGDIMVSSNLPVYCLFVAPAIHPQTAEQFRLQTWYKEDRYEPVCIVPITLSRFEMLLDVIRENRLAPCHLRDFIMTAVGHRASGDGVRWLADVDKEFLLWRNRLLGTPSAGSCPLTGTAGT